MKKIRRTLVRRISHQTENLKKMLVYVPGTYISPFALLIALERRAPSNPSSRERLFLRTVNPREDPQTATYMADTKRVAAHRRPGPERGVTAYRRTPEHEQTIFTNHLQISGQATGRL